MESQGAPLTDTTSRQAICFINQVDSYDNVQVTCLKRLRMRKRCELDRHHGRRTFTRAGAADHVTRETIAEITVGRE
jgi:hypothetical protein